MESWTRNCEEQYNGEKIVFSIDGVGAMGHPYTKIIVIIWTHISYSRHNKMDLRPNVKCRTIKFLEDNIGKNQGDLGYGDAFLGTTPKSWLINSTSLKFKTALWKALSREWKHKPQGRRKYLPKDCYPVNLCNCHPSGNKIQTIFIVLTNTPLMKSEK